MTLSSSLCHPQGTKSKLRHYKQQNQQKLELNREIAHLTTVLEHEQAKKKARLKLNDVPFNSVWRDFAMRHLELRLASEAQRQWLMTAISGKVDIIDGLKSVIRQHMKIAALIAGESEEQKSELFVEPTDELLYAMDMQDINEHYMLTDVVFGNSGLDFATENGYMQRTVTTDSNGVSVKFGRMQNMMFSYEETCRSIWMLSNHVHRQLDRDEFDGFEDPETMHAAKFRINCRYSDGRAASLKQRIITRRFMENDRMVMVWKAVIAGDGPLSGIQIDESGWTIIRPSPTGSGTIMQVCISQVPLHLNNPVPETVAHQFNDLLQSIIHESDLEIHAGAEALLIENEMTGFDLLARRRKRAQKKTS